MPTVKFITLGCKVNQYDSQRIREQFQQAGFREMKNGQPADVAVINTCTVTHRADADSLNIIRKAIRQNPKAKIVVTGCLTAFDIDKIRRIREVDIIVKIKDQNKITQLLPRKFNLGIRNVMRKSNTGGITDFQGHTRVFLKIQDGCNNFCSYCKIPLVRGASYSRELAEIIQEARGLVRNGFKEIVLCGICLGIYGQDLVPRIDIVALIEQLEAIPGILRIRLSSIEARDVSERLIAKMFSSAKLCRQLHIPLQSGDDVILKRMNRDYTASEYVNLIKKVKRAVPDIAITTDVMVGFSGETEANFQNTVAIIKKIKPARLHIFPYSPREGTLAAAKYQDKIDPGVVKERFAVLKKAAQLCAYGYRRRFLNRRLQVLFERKTKSGFWEGYTDTYLKVRLKSDKDIENKLLVVKLTQERLSNWMEG